MPGKPGVTNCSTGLRNRYPCLLSPLRFTLGSTGDAGRGFVEDLKQISMENYASAFAGGVIFNLSNILLSASVSMAGLTVAFPLGVGIALVLGVFVNYFGEPKGDAVILFSGVALVVLAIIFNAIAPEKESERKQHQ